MHAITKSAPAQSPAVTLAVDLAKDVFELTFADADDGFTESHSPFCRCNASTHASVSVPGENKPITMLIFAIA